MHPRQERFCDELLENPLFATPPPEPERPRPPFIRRPRVFKLRSEQLLTKELNELWKDTKHSLIMGASLPFILFKTDKIDRDIHDPAFDKPPGVQRTKVAMEIWVVGGSKIGKVIIELFTDVAPRTCQLVVPNLYCRCGDVTKDNGFGCYVPDGETDPMGAENYSLKHTVPGVLSMAVSSDNEVYGHFNIVFKPLSQFDGKNVVFGR
ncbi:Peptidyl-prolyl cis-trans isomerase E, partial [Operophtera brumata]